MEKRKAMSTLAVLLLLVAVSVTGSATPAKQPLNPSNYTSPNTVPAFPVVRSDNKTCHLDLSDELFGGVSDACGHTLDRSRCCPVLAAWLFAAHARTALTLDSEDNNTSSSEWDPMVPDDSQKCVDSLHSSLRQRDIVLLRPNSTCDTVLCFCGIRLHQLSSLRCSSAFNLSATHHNATPAAVVTDLEKNCRNSSYSGCTRCLQSLDKVGGGVVKSSSKSGSGERGSKMLGRDCELMGLTWLLARNKTEYIATVSAVLRALLYSARPANKEHHYCSPDQENMPLAVDSLQFHKLQNSAAAQYLGFVRLMMVFMLTAVVVLPPEV